MNFEASTVLASVHGGSTDDYIDPCFAVTVFQRDISSYYKR